MAIAAVAHVFVFLAKPYQFLPSTEYGKITTQTTKATLKLGRSTACPVNFEFQNYTIITSQCKGPQYPPNLCCPAFKEFACPFVDAINDLSNDCATTMFSYINLYGKYPPGLFASLCREGKEGLACSASAPTQLANSSGSQIIRNPSPLLVLTTSLLVLLSRLF